MYNLNEEYVSAGEVELANPTPGPHWVETAESLPAAKADGDLKVTLTDFVAGITHDPKASAYWNGRALTRAEFQLEQAGHDRLAWKVQPVHPRSDRERLEAKS